MSRFYRTLFEGWIEAMPEGFVCLMIAAVGVVGLSLGFALGVLLMAVKAAL